jgi:hypothetical protein
MADGLDIAAAEAVPPLGNIFPFRELVSAGQLGLEFGGPPRHLREGEEDGVANVTAA